MSCYSTSSCHSTTSNTTGLTEHHCPKCPVVLGQIHSNTHFIPPVQPTWVTEYASSYTAPPKSAYMHGNSVVSSNGSLKRSNISPQPVKESHADQQQQQDLFQQLLHTVQSLPKNFESKIRNDLLRVLSQMNLDTIVDQAYGKFSNKLSDKNINGSTKKQLEEFIKLVDKLRELHVLHGDGHQPSGNAKS